MWHSLSSMDMYASPLIDAGTLCTICLAVLMLAINRSKVVQFRNRIAPNRLPAFRPISRTNLTVFILHRHRVMSVPPPHERTRNPTHGELERLHKTQRLIDRASNGQIVHRDLSQHPLGIDQIARAERDPLSSIKHPYSRAMHMLRSASSGMRKLGPRPPAARSCCNQTWCSTSTSSQSALE